VPAKPTFWARLITWRKEAQPIENYRSFTFLKTLYTCNAKIKKGKMTKIGKEQVRKDVLEIIATFTTLNASELRDDYILRSPPVLIDNIGLGYLALSLRGYIKQHNPDATIKASELRRANMTVGAVISIIILRVEAE
jgi:hypothetical protein